MKKLLFPLKAGYFLDVEATVSFSQAQNLAV
jgi:hypothetical protein